jgi:hypothetical protein
MKSVHRDVTVEHRPDNSFWEAFGSAVAALARRTGSSVSGCPLPEVREAARDLRGLRHEQASEPDRRIAA